MIPSIALPSSLNLDLERDLMTIIHQEIATLSQLTTHLPSQAYDLIRSLLTLQGKIVFSGLGKSGLVARKLAATFCSLGIPALFLHPNDALHGDLGIIQPNDIVIIFSKSASGEEFERILSFLDPAQHHSVLIACTQGPLSKKVNLFIELPFDREACPLNLAPTSSTTLMMLFGDAIGLVTAHYKKFNVNDFARFHPAGIIGKRLLLTARDLMHHSDALPCIGPSATFQEVLITITQKKLGVAIVVNEQYEQLGIITDGDLRRACNLGITVFNKRAEDIMTINPKSVGPGMLAQTALEIMKAHKITTLTVLHEQRVIGLLHLHDIIRAGLS